MAPEGIAVWNPGFDVTPAELITGGIITEKGVIRQSKKGGAGAEEIYFDVEGFLQGQGNHGLTPTPCTGKESSLVVPKGYKVKSYMYTR